MEHDDQQQADGNLPYLQIKLNTIATLKGVRGMAEAEVRNGSTAWKRAIALIDISIDELGQL